MRIVLSLLFMNVITHTMHNQIIPVPAPTITPAQLEIALSDNSSVSDEDLCSWALTRFCGREAVPKPVSPVLTAAIASRIRGSMHDDLEDDAVHAMVIQAVNEALESKEKEIRSRISKRHSAYIAVITGIISTTITALAAIYNTTHNKCS